MFRKWVGFWIWMLGEVWVEVEMCIEWVVFLDIFSLGLEFLVLGREKVFLRRSI